MRRHVVLLVTLSLTASTACAPDRPADPGRVGGGGFPGGSGGGGGGAAPCDVDGDGHLSLLCGGQDCSDGDPAVHPGAQELCDGVDSTCDGTVDEGCECPVGDLRRCWTGKLERRGVGSCRDGVQRCVPGGTWGECEGEVGPTQEGVVCDGLDQDCDGEADDPSCRRCPGGGPEVCGNGLDDDCDGHVDDASLCTLDCAAVNPRDPEAAALACCSERPRPSHSSRCIEWTGLAPCESEARACLDLDGDPSTACFKACDGGSCVCGRPGEPGQVVAVPDCGFLTPCARADCGGRTGQPCYSGPPGTLGVGVCHGGKHSCIDEGGSRSWDSCEGEHLPGTEICGNDLDDDCDGLTDENDEATGRACPQPDCTTSAPEICGNGVDDDCDGVPDEHCQAPMVGEQACWTGSLLNRNVGSCRDGTQREVDGYWGPCEGEVLPSAEACGDGVDSDCDGLGAQGGEEDPSCCVARTEMCNGADDDCDGLADEGLLTHCGTCEGPCFDWETDDPGCDRAGRTCVNVAASELDPSAITLSPGPAAGPAGKVFVTDITLGHSLIVIDAQSGEATEPVALGYDLGDLVAAPDGTVWILGSTQHVRRLEHRDATGELLCTEVVNSDWLSVDASGNAWLLAGPWHGSYFLDRFTGEKYVADDGTIACKGGDWPPGDIPIGLDRGGVSVNDANGYLWFLGDSLPSLSRVDVLGPTFREERLDLPMPPSYRPNAATDSDGRIYVSGTLFRVDTRGPFDGTPAALYPLPDGAGLHGFALAADGTIWGYRSSAGSPAIVHLDPSGKEIASHQLSGSPFFNELAMDGHGNLWFSTSSALGGTIHRLNTVTGDIEPILTGSWNLAVHHGSTTGPLRDVSRRRGSWTQVIDSGGHDVGWKAVRWSEHEPARTRVAVALRFADTEDGLETSTVVCGPFDTPPADLSGCEGRRFARLEVWISGYGEPSVSDLEVTWDRE